MVVPDDHILIEEKGRSLVSIPSHLYQTHPTVGKPCRLLLLAAACSPNIQQRGNPVDAEKLKQIVVGTSKKSEVQSLLGSPTYESPFTNNWYYATTTQRYSAFFRPETTEAAVVSIAFDPEGVVTSLDTQTPEQADKVEATNRKIETIGEKPPFCNSCSAMSANMLSRKMPILSESIFHLARYSRTLATPIVAISHSRALATNATKKPGARFSGAR
jgi:outer membrane protein assembly factor BamE (lipoprotein component of BamABCDE complex)